MAAHGLAEVPPIFYARYDQCGGQPGPTVLLLHGAGGNYLSWPPQLRRLQQAVVYAIDLPGHGQSEPCTLHAGATLQIATYSAIVNALLTQWSLENVVLIGHSMGAAIALECALAAAEAPASAIRGLVLIGSGATLPVNQRIFSGLQADFDAMTAKLVDWMYAPGLPAPHRERAIAELRKNPLPQLLADFQACNAFDVRSQLQRVQIPTLIICGALDQMTPVSSSRQVADALAASELQIVPERGHMVMLEEPQVVTDLVQHFIHSTYAAT
jgi:pimeloyl-ACP methyl ester carboxylesterase